MITSQVQLMAVNDTGKCHVLLLNDVLIECLTTSSSHFDEGKVIRRKIHKENPSRHFMWISNNDCGNSMFIDIL